MSKLSLQTLATVVQDNRRRNASTNYSMPFVFLQALTAVLPDDGNRDAFEPGDGPGLLLLLLDAAQSRSAGWVTSRGPSLPI